MMPIFSMLIKNSGGGGGSAVNFNNDSVSDSVIDPANASAGWQIGPANVTGSGISSYGWLNSGVNTDYQAQATVVSGALTSGTTGTWITLNTSPQWIVQRNTPGVANAIVDFECRRVSDSVVIASWTVTFEAIVDI